MIWTWLTALALGAGGGGEIGVQFGVCVHCHGAHGEGRPELGAPRLGDLDPGYVELQLAAFRDGSRGHGPEDSGRPMVAVASGLPEGVLVDLATYITTLEPQYRERGPAVAGGAAAWGPCAACHGPDARGNAALKAPDLLFQDPDYLALQLRKYRDGARGGPKAHPLAQAMAGVAKTLTDDQIARLVGHIASLRPERPALEQYEVTRSEEEGLEAWAGIYSVLTHPRCLNCHPAGDAPLHTEDSVPHDFGITRFSPLDGVHCSTCHPASVVGDGQAPLPPADPIWSLAPKEAVFEGRSSAELCVQLKDPALNQGRGPVGLTEHIRVDHLLQTSWHMGRPAPPLTHPELVEAFETWGQAGGPCPE